MKGKRRCGYCERLVIPPGIEPSTRAGLLICGACECEYKNIFANSLTTVNNLANLRPVATLNNLEGWK